MAGRKENIRALFSNTKTRIIILLTGLLLVVAITVGFLKFSGTPEISGVDKMKSAPSGMQSIPGSLDQTAQYAALQEMQNSDQAKNASVKGGSAIPTIIRTHAFGEGVGLVTPEGSEGGVGFTVLGLADELGPQQSLWLQSLKDGRCSAAAIKQVISQGAMIEDLKRGCDCGVLRENGYTLKELITVCTCPELKEAGFSASNMKAVDFNIEKLRRCGFSACEVRGAEFSAKQMALAGFTQGELKGAGFPSKEIEAANGLPEGVTMDDIRKAGCVPEELAKLRKKGVSAAQIVRMSGCDAAALKAAGFTAKELKDAGFSAADLRAAGFSAAELKDAGFSAKQLKDAGFSAAELKAAGFTAKELKDAGYSAEELKAAGFKGNDLDDNMDSLGNDMIESIPSLSKNKSLPGSGDNAAAKAKQLQDIMAQQKLQASEQRYQTKIKQRANTMLSAANKVIQGWGVVAAQVYVGGQAAAELVNGSSEPQKGLHPGRSENADNTGSVDSASGEMQAQAGAIKSGDILFAVLDTSVNTDEPGPILATIVSGRLKGSKLIGSFNLPSNADKMVVTFNTLSMLGADKTISINAYAIDPDTARTALSSRTNHHYLMKYGSLFASTFMAGFSSAIQSADTTITVGGTGGTTTTEVQNGIDRSTLDNALIGLGAVGQAWAQEAQKNMSKPTTVELYSGTGIGVLFTQDVTLI